MDTLQHNWHLLSFEGVASILETNTEEGLGETKVKERRKLFGRNLLPQEKTPSRFLVFFSQLKSPLILILIGAGIITLFLKDFTDSIVIWGAVILNSFLGYFQEYRANKALAELKKALKIQAIVIRGGTTKEIPQEDIVPGDVLLLKAGDRVAADARVAQAWNLKVQEAALTGEWLASEKTNTALKGDIPLGDRENMVFTGSVVEEGKGKAIVTSIGKNTELGKIASLLKEIQGEQTPYQLRLNKFARFIGYLFGFIAFLIFLQGIVAGRNFEEIFTLAVATAVASVPEGLPVAITAVLAIGMTRMLRRKGLIRNLASTETLGSTSVIATDKTLTLTEGRMEMDEIFSLDPTDSRRTLTIAALANDAFVENPDAVFQEWIVRGKPTDKALLIAAMEAGISKTNLEKEFPVLEKISFESATQYQASIHQTPGGIVAFISGSPEKLLSMSGLNEKLPVEKKLAELTERGLRVLALGQKVLPFKTFPASDHVDLELHDIEFVGLIALKDPLRKGVKEAIARAREAGIETIMVTGDHARTASAVAKEVGIDGSPTSTMEGKELEKLSDQDLDAMLPHVKVYARVEPRHKLRIIEAWQRRGQIIAMTGDGVNDAPALKKADIGIALGSGTEVAKETGDLVLLGDSFSIIPLAIEEGRIIVDNIRKIITYMLTGSFTEIILISASILLGLPLPITASQILWVNFVEDGLPGIALTFEKGEKDVMKRRPEGKHIQLLTLPMKTIIFLVGISTDLILLGLFLYLLKFSSYTIEHIRTIVFVGLALNSLLYVFSCKNLKTNIWRYNVFSNPHLVVSVLIGLFVLLLPLYITPLQQLFHTQPLLLMDWAIVSGFAILNIVLIELVKWVFIRKNHGIVQ
ncbi:MAG: HAD-IC family P-type ATPase [Candidatus Wildermuthbacteria bacterium]|nr:HAD-IC family P-type ATPase [Candidatus Wildermuthbacteria bacterium]